MKVQKILITAVALSAVLFAGCAGPSGVTELRADEKGRFGGTGVESQDLVHVSDKIARGILSAPQIANATTPPVIVLEPV